MAMTVTIQWDIGKGEECEFDFVELLMTPVGHSLVHSFRTDSDAIWRRAVCEVKERYYHHKDEFGKAESIGFRLQYPLCSLNCKSEALIGTLELIVPLHPAPCDKGNATLFVCPTEKDEPKRQYEAEAVVLEIDECTCQ